MPGPGGDTTARKLLAGEVARTATLKATWSIALACTLEPFPTAKMMVLELIILHDDDATADANGFPTNTTHE